MLLCGRVASGRIAQNTVSTLYNFIVDDDVEKFGSDWQRLVCRQIMVNKEVCERFWNDRRQEKTARKAMNRRRQNTCSAMKKKRFQGKGRCGWLAEKFKIVSVDSFFGFV
jgi:hypothetical protein